MAPRVPPPNGPDADPFGLDLDVFLAGAHGRDLDVDPIFAKPFARVLAELRRDAPFDVAIGEGRSRPSRIDPRCVLHEVGAGILLTDAAGTAIGGYLSYDLALDEAYRGRGLGTELVIERVLADGAVPTWQLDAPAYSPAGLAAHAAAWRRMRDLRDRGDPAIGTAMNHQPH